jgi:hypothetical protein
MKYRSGGSTPPKPTAAERAADAKFRKSVKDLKVTPENAKAIGRGNRSTGMAEGGKVKKMAFGGKTKTMPDMRSLSKAMQRTPSVIGPSANKANAIANSDKLQQGAAAKAAQASSTASAPARTPTNIGRLNMGHAKGGKATKFGKALVKKSADTKGRAMMKFAKGGSIDGCAVKGKTKTSMIKMKKGGSC